MPANKESLNEKAAEEISAIQHASFNWQSSASGKFESADVEESKIQNLVAIGKELANEYGFVCYVPMIL
jgi:hypothetical protein